MNDSTSRDETLLNIIKTAPSAKGRLIRYAVTTLVIAALALGLMMYLSGGKTGTTDYVTEGVIRGNLTVTVSATGKLQPTNEVEVGSELSGTVEKVFADENDHVKRGEILAQLDTAKLTDQVTKSEAAVNAAEAQVAQAKATAVESAANLSRLRKVSELSGGKVPSQTELESAEAALLRAQANEKSADAAVAQAIAALKSDQTNLAKASIRSPIDGIVLTRQIEPGQTVAASLQTPVLFTLAENLTQMELQVDVDEADVGHVKAGQPAFFTVDAWPGREYPADIVRVSYGSQVTDNVVTYTTLLKVNNDDLTLRPGMTATAEITTASRHDVLLVPNAALRFTPPQTDEQTKSRGLVGSLLPHPPSRNNQKKAAATNNGSPQVWVLRDNMPVAVPVKTGLSDGRHTEIVSGDLQVGAQVITGMQTVQK